MAASWPRAGCVCRCALPLRLPLRWHTTCDSSDGKCTAHAPCSVTHCALTGRLEEARLGARHLYVSCAAPTGRGSIRFCLTAAVVSVSVCKAQVHATLYTTRTARQCCAAAYGCCMRLLNRRCRGTRMPQHSERAVIGAADAIRQSVAPSAAPSQTACSLRCLCAVMICAATALPLRCLRAVALLSLR